ncbi:Apoptosis-inducing factor B [Candida viswanathii]|uniref:Apoptosis-inducing factor B n=1 Tax=Candida viswanathii TaxID=5486 RepID=A0A367XNH2_9ASCO|nr:Apoptosis-inducing factor B [Candida viswanathii]
MTTERSKKAVIIGGSYAGFLALKTLLRSSRVKLDVTMISPSKLAYFNAAAPRLLVEPKLVEKTVYSIPESMKKLATGTIHRADFHQGSVSNVNLDKRLISVGDSHLSYDNLIIASGARTKAAVFKLDNARDETYTLGALKQASSDIKEAKSIAVIGGGSTGVETAAEIAYNYRDKSVVLFTGGSGPLSGFSSRYMTEDASDQLQKLGIEIVNDVLVNVDGKFVVAPTGEKKEFDLVIEALGTIPNTEFLPSKVLNKFGLIETDEYLRVKDYPDAIAAGDVVSLGTGSIFDLKYNQEPVLERTLEYEVLDDKSVTLEPYVQPTSFTSFTPIGKDGGVGMLFGWNTPNFLVKAVKSKDYMIPKGADHFT